MGFTKGNKLSSGRPAGSKNKKTIAFESLKSLSDIGITPLETSKFLINSLVQDTELKNSEKIQLLSTMTSLFKYQLLSRAEEIRLDELQQENNELEEQNKALQQEKDTYFCGTPEQLLKTLQET